MAVVSTENPLVQTYVFYATLLCLKTLAMALLTGRMRHQKNVYSNEEDAKVNMGKVQFDDPDVERVRRAHLNDLENIPMFLVLGFFYILTEPSVAVATMLFRIVTVCRFVHTYVYAVKPRQPARAISYGIPFFISMYMGVRVCLNFSSGF